MHKYILLLLILLFAGEAKSWGFYGHRKINRMAIYALPPEMFDFFKANIDYLEQHAVDPDKRRYSDKQEGARHYIDLDHYLQVDRTQDILPQIQCVLPIYWKEAAEKFTEDSLKAYGIVPWHLQWMLFRLTEAFTAGDAARILKLATEMGHYAADAHVPLHTTENYNGQLTGQKGIHGLWESRIPERHAEKYNFMLERASYLDEPVRSIWEVVSSSHQEVEYVLSREMDLRKNYDQDKIYRQSKSGRTVKKDFTSGYVDAYNERLGKMVEKRMVASSQFVANLWFTAWVNAGQPGLPVLVPNLPHVSDTSRTVVDEREHE